MFLFSQAFAYLDKYLMAFLIVPIDVESKCASLKVLSPASTERKSQEQAGYPINASSKVGLYLYNSHLLNLLA